jgi:hypothetical protein
MGMTVRSILAMQSVVAPRSELIGKTLGESTLLRIMASSLWAYGDGKDGYGQNYRASKFGKVMCW